MMGQWKFELNGKFITSRVTGNNTIGFSNEEIYNFIFLKMGQYCSIRMCTQFKLKYAPITKS